jgi:hypothetical protein
MRFETVGISVNVFSWPFLSKARKVGGKLGEIIIEELIPSPNMLRSQSKSVKGRLILQRFRLMKSTKIITRALHFTTWPPFHHRPCEDIKQLDYPELLSGVEVGIKSKFVFPSLCPLKVRQIDVNARTRCLFGQCMRNTTHNYIYEKISNKIKNKNDNWLERPNQSRDSQNDLSEISLSFFYLAHV